MTHYSRSTWLPFNCTASAIVITIFGVAYLGLGNTGDSLFAQTAQAPDAQIVLFTPSDIKPPPEDEYTERLNQFGHYAEDFFHEGIQHWGFESGRKEIFKRGEDGEISVLHITGDLPYKNDEFKKEWISRQVTAKLRTDHKLKPYGQLYWIFVYVGDPPEISGTFKGSGNSKIGGWGVAQYVNEKGSITPGKDMVSTVHNKFLLKGCIHEFGHGLGLDHIGPKPELKMGNTLMGPTTKIYVQKKMPRKTKAYLSQANAAILSVHPLFTQSVKDRNETPATTFENTNIKYNKQEHTINVSGTLKSTSQKPFRVIVLDDRDDKWGAYWIKDYVSEVDDQSRFSVTIPEPNRSGKIKLLAVYENGAVTGNGKRRGIGSAKEIPYSFGTK